jgi:prepilin-type N-terminal cleavage/methylation domain-containing protein
MPRHAGFSLVELIVAMTLVAFGLVAVAGAALLAERTMAEAEVIERITREAATVLDSLAAHPNPASGVRDARGLLLRWVVEPDSFGTRLRLQAALQRGGRPVRLEFEARHAPR